MNEVRFNAGQQNDYRQQVYRENAGLAAYIPRNPTPEMAVKKAMGLLMLDEMLAFKHPQIATLLPSPILPSQYQAKPFTRGHDRFFFIARSNLGVMDIIDALPPTIAFVAKHTAEWEYEKGDDYDALVIRVRDLAMGYWISIIIKWED